MDGDQGYLPVSGHTVNYKHYYFRLISVFCDGYFRFVGSEKVRIILEG
jgi:hypothetical protein